MKTYSVSFQQLGWLILPLWEYVCWFQFTVKMTPKYFTFSSVRNSVLIGTIPFAIVHAFTSIHPLNSSPVSGGACKYFWGKMWYIRPSCSYKYLFLIRFFRLEQESCGRILSRTNWWQWHLQVGGGHHRTSWYTLVRLMIMR